MARRPRTSPLEARLLHARVPPGVPAGGEFAPRLHGEPGVDLDDTATTTVVAPPADGGVGPVGRTADQESSMPDPAPAAPEPGLGQRLLRRLTTSKLDRYRDEVKGSPKDGRKFDPSWHVDWGGTVTQDEIDAMREGTWAHPPYPRSAKAMAYFWMNVPVPDYVVDCAAEHCPKGTHPEVVRTLCRVSAMVSTASRPPMAHTDEAVRLHQLAIPFPDGSIFRPMDALRWWGVADAHRLRQLTPTSATPWLLTKGT